MSMLVSRPVEMFRRALKSIMVSQVPDELLVFPSPELDWNLEEELDGLSSNVSIRILQQEPAAVIDVERARAYYPKLSASFLSRKWMHTYDLVVRGVLEASNEWVRMCDDDDEMFGDVRPYLDVVANNVAIINGDFYFCDFVRDTWDRKSGKGKIGRHKGAQGSTNCFRKKAVEAASVHWEPGPWPDWQLTYHMHRLGWTNFYVNEILSIQHWHGKNSSRARSGFIGWSELAGNLERWWDRGNPEPIKDSAPAQARVATDMRPRAQALPDYTKDVQK